MTTVTISSHICTLSVMPNVFLSVCSFYIPQSRSGGAPAMAMPIPGASLERTTSLPTTPERVYEPRTYLHPDLHFVLQLIRFCFAAANVLMWHSWLIYLGFRVFTILGGGMCACPCFMYDYVKLQVCGPPGLAHTGYCQLYN